MINLNGTLFKLVVEVLSPLIGIKMTINEAKSSALKKILKVGEDSENPRLKSSTTVGAVNSNQEFVINVVTRRTKLVLFRCPIDFSL
jgi:hypothetical protein